MEQEADPINDFQLGMPIDEGEQEFDLEERKGDNHGQAVFPKANGFIGNGIRRAQSPCNASTNERHGQYAVPVFLPAKPARRPSSAEAMRSTWKMPLSSMGSQISQ